MVLAFQILLNRSYNQSVAKRMPVFNTSAVMLSIPGALLFFRLLTAFTISFLCCWRTVDFQFVPQGLKYTSPLCWIWSVSVLTFCPSLKLFILDCDSLSILIFHCTAIALEFSRQVPCYSVQLTLLPPYRSLFGL